MPSNQKNPQEWADRAPKGQGKNEGQVGAQQVQGCIERQGCRPCGDTLQGLSSGYGQVKGRMPGLQLPSGQAGHKWGSWLACP